MHGSGAWGAISANRDIGANTYEGFSVPEVTSVVNAAVPFRDRSTSQRGSGRG
jgi:hypothetical protein